MSRARSYLDDKKTNAQRVANAQDLLKMQKLMPNFSYANTPRQDDLMKLIIQHKYCLAYGGAGSGKTWGFVRALIIRAIKYPGTSHLIIRKELSTCRASIGMQTIPQIIKSCFPNLRLTQNKVDSTFTLSNGSVIRLAGAANMDDLRKILGLSQMTIYLNEASELLPWVFEECKTRMRENADLMDLEIYKGTNVSQKIFVDCNPTLKSHWTNKVFNDFLLPDGSPILPKDQKLYGVINMHPRSNIYMSNEYLDTLETGLTAKMKRRFYVGEFIDDSEGALWSQSDIDNNRVPYQNAHNLMQHIPLAQIVIGVDPATSKTEDSDLTGIVAVGTGAKLSKEGREHLYVLADKSGRYSPNEWAKVVISLYNNLEANCVVAESNQGGDMITEILRNNGFRGKIELVHASKGKLTRAEPWEALYEQGYVHHITSSELAELEIEMTTYSPYLLTGPDASPDRMDAMVWAGNYLTQHNNHARYRNQFDPEAFLKAEAKFKQTWRQPNGF
jgi:hypothetical protein